LGGDVVKKGFTLIELLVVIAILGILATVVAVSVSGKDVAAKRSLTVTSIARLKGEVDLFKVHENRYPARLEELVEKKQLDEVPKDAWNRPFVYRTPGERGAPFDIVSTAADGQPGGHGADEDLWSHPPK
jgi:general secretion pathway protein G